MPPGKAVTHQPSRVHRGYRGVPSRDSSPTAARQRVRWRTARPVGVRAYLYFGRVPSLPAAGERWRARLRLWRREGGLMGSVIKKRRKRMAKKKHRKLLKKTRIQRRNKK